MTVLVSSTGELVTAAGTQTGLSKPSVPLSQFGTGGAGGLDLIGDRVVSYGEIYRTQWAVATAVHKIERQISRLPLKAYRRTADGDRERLRSGYLASLLGRPWTGGAATHLKQAIALPTLVHGNGLLRKVRQERAGAVTEFQPIPWERIRIHADPGGPVNVWEVTMPGVPRYLDPSEVIHFGFRGLDGDLGVSPLRQLGTSLSIEDAAQRYQQSIMRNSARPPGALEMDEEFTGLTPEQKLEAMGAMRQDVDRLYAGPENAGVPIILPPGLAWKAVGHTAVEAELIEQRKIAREEVFACYDVSPPLVGLLERSNVQQHRRASPDALRHRPRAVADVDRGDAGGAAHRAGAHAAR